MDDLNVYKGKKIYVGLSGGVDSAVTAALLQKAGAVVTGVFIKGWYPPELRCTWADDRRDAMRVAAKLHIPFITYDASSAYKKSVIEYMLEEYKHGRTPNPDIMCNRDVKFGAFFEYAMRTGAEYVATGHYAQTVHTGTDVQLLRGVDEGKDQSYFLWAVKKEALQKTLFPLGGFKKEEVRRMAEEFGLPNASKKDSQGICFLGEVSIEEFLQAEIGGDKGEAHTEDGEFVGYHNGSIFYTLGERVALSGAPQGPWYVSRKDLNNNVLTVQKDAVASLPISNIELTSVVQHKNLKQDEIVEAQFRYHGEKISGTYDEAMQTFFPKNPLSDLLARGQSLVIYRNDEVLLGGIIK